MRREGAAPGSAVVSRGGGGNFSRACERALGLVIGESLLRDGGCAAGSPRIEHGLNYFFGEGFGEQR